MYNEVKRFYLFRRRRWADTLFDTLYHVIFILGFYSLLRKILTFSCPISIIISSWPKWFPWAMKSWSTRFGRDNPLAFSMLCNQCIEFTCNEQWFTLFGCLWSSGLLCFWFIRVYQLTFLLRSSVSKDCSWYWLVSWFSSAIILSWFDWPSASNGFQSW